jgi:hypothetical protein
VVELREAEEAAARKRAEEARKAERESKPHCYLHPTRDSLPPCALAGQPITPTPIDPVMKEIVWGVTGLNEAKDCIKDPKLGKCAGMAAMVLPIGGFKALKNLDNTLQAAAEASRVSRIAEASKLAFKAAENPAEIFVKNKHLNIPGGWGRAAKFDSTSVTEVQGWVAEGLKKSDATFLPNGDGSFKVVVDMGRPVGTKGQTGIRIMVNDEGKVFNCFPVNI